MSLILFAALAGVLMGVLIVYKSSQRAERWFTLGWIGWKLAVIPMYLLILYSLLSTGGILALVAAFFLSVFAVMYILIFEPHNDLRQFRRQG